jgi:hypothetical protein
MPIERKPIFSQGRAIAQAVSRRLSLLRPGFEPRSGRVGLLVDEVALGQVFFEYFGFLMPILIPPTAPHSSSIVRGWYNRPVSDRRTKWT